jgi:hypothetical protein
MEIGEYVDNVPELRRYRMPTFESANGWVAVANQKRYLSLDTCSPEHRVDFRRRHPRMKCGKGCINFRDRDAIRCDDLESVVRTAMDSGR